MSNESATTISSPTGLERKYLLDEDITPLSVRPLIQEILKINKEDDENEKKLNNFVRKPLEIYIGTYGGSCYAGYHLISHIENSKTPIHTYVTGYAMSMGLPIALSGHKKFASKYATYMYHSVWNGAVGHLEWMKNQVEETERLQSLYDNYVLNKTKLRQKDLDHYRERQIDWYIPSDEALKLGFVDELI